VLFLKINLNLLEFVFFMEDVCLNCYISAMPVVFNFVMLAYILSCVYVLHNCLQVNTRTNIMSWIVV
jgi:hypothetical protein